MSVENPTLDPAIAESQQSAAVGNLQLGSRTDCYPADMASRTSLGRADYADPEGPLHLDEAEALIATLEEQGAERDDRGRYMVPGFDGITVEEVGNGGLIIKAEEGSEGLVGILDEDPEKVEGFKKLLGTRVYSEMTCRAVARKKGLKVMGYITDIGGEPTDLTYEWAMDSGEFDHVVGGTRYIDSESGEVMEYDTLLSALKRGDRSQLDRIGTFIVSDEGIVSWIDQDGYIKLAGSSPDEIAKLEALGYTEGDWHAPFSEGEIPNDDLQREHVEQEIFRGMLKRGDTMTVDEWHQFLSRRGEQGWRWTTSAPMGVIRG